MLLKKLAVLLIAAAMTALLCVVGATVYSEDAEPEIMVIADDEHGGHGGWTQLTSSNTRTTLQAGNLSGFYYFYEDASVKQGNYGIGSISLSGDTTICLNGKNIDFTGTYFDISNNDNYTLTICDCQGGGTISGNHNSGVVSVITGGFKMEGGTIRYTNTGNTATAAIATYLSKSNINVDISGGEIYSNKYALSITGNRDASDSFKLDLNISGGTISGDTAAISTTTSEYNVASDITISGGANIIGGQTGIDVSDKADYTGLTIEGGTVQGTSGNGISFGGSGGINSLTVTGGEISGGANGIDITSSGRLAVNGTANITGGQYGLCFTGISSTCELSGSPTITGTTAGIYFNVSGGINSHLKLTDTLSNIYSVTANATCIFTNTDDSVKATYNKEANFTPVPFGSQDYGVKIHKKKRDNDTEEGQLELFYPIIVYFDYAESSFNGTVSGYQMLTVDDNGKISYPRVNSWTDGKLEQATYELGDTYENLPIPKSPGQIFVGWYEEDLGGKAPDDGGKPINSNTPVTASGGDGSSSRTIHAAWQPCDHGSHLTDTEWEYWVCTPNEDEETHHKTCTKCWYETDEAHANYIRNLLGGSREGHYRPNTCVDPGLTDQECDFCEKEFYDREIGTDNSKHSDVTGDGFAWYNTDPNEHWQYCTNTYQPEGGQLVECDYTTGRERHDVNEDKWVITIVRDANCAETRIERQDCLKCGYQAAEVDTGEYDTTNHILRENGKYYTDDDETQYTQHWQYCDREGCTVKDDRSRINITSHEAKSDANTVTVDPTCVKDGTTTVTCGTCFHEQVTPIELTREDLEDWSTFTTYHQSSGWMTDNNWQDDEEDTHWHECTRENCRLLAYQYETTNGKYRFDEATHTPVDDDPYYPENCQEHFYSSQHCEICTVATREFHDYERIGPHSYEEWENKEADTKTKKTGAQQAWTTHDETYHYRYCTVPKDGGTCGEEDKEEHGAYMQDVPGTYIAPDCVTREREADQTCSECKLYTKDGAVLETDPTKHLYVAKTGGTTDIETAAAWFYDKEGFNINQSEGFILLYELSGLAHWHVCVNEGAAGFDEERENDTHCRDEAVYSYKYGSGSGDIGVIVGEQTEHTWQPDSEHEPDDCQDHYWSDDRCSLCDATDRHHDYERIGDHSWEADPDQEWEYYDDEDHDSDYHYRYCTNVGSNGACNEEDKDTHTYTDYEARVPATCVSTGHEKHEQCEDCRHIKYGEEIPINEDHLYVAKNGGTTTEESEAAWYYESNAEGAQHWHLCVRPGANEDNHKDGTGTYGDGSTGYKVNIDDHDFKYSETIKGSVCTELDKDVYTCGCGASYDDYKDTSSGAHVGYGSAQNINDPAVHEYVCSAGDDCKNPDEHTYTEPHTIVMSNGEATPDPICIEVEVDGWCSECHYGEDSDDTKITIPATGPHKYRTDGKWDDVDENGHWRICQYALEAYGEDVESHRETSSHDYDLNGPNTIIEPKCYEDGKVRFDCTVDEDCPYPYYDSLGGERPPHNFSAWQWEEMPEGHDDKIEHWRYCQNEGCTEKEYHEHTPAGDWKYEPDDEITEEMLIEALSSQPEEAAAIMLLAALQSDEEEGKVYDDYHWQICSECGKLFFEEHHWKDVVHAATTTAKGEKYKECEICGKTKDYEELDMLDPEDPDNSEDPEDTTTTTSFSWPSNPNNPTTSGSGDNTTGGSSDPPTTTPSDDPTTTPPTDPNDPHNPGGTDPNDPHNPGGTDPTDPNNPNNPGGNGNGGNGSGNGGSGETSGFDPSTGFDFGSGGGISSTGGSSNPGTKLGRGRVIVSVRSEEGAPAIGLDNASVKRLEQNAIDGLTAEERASVEGGDTIEIILIVTRMDENDDLIAKDKALTKAFLKDSPYNPGVYLDVQIVKYRNGQYIGNITRLSSDISITFEIPEELRKDGRTFSMVRVHTGVTDMLADRDNHYDTLTILTDRFSTYVIAYRGSSDNPLENPNTAGSEAAAGLSILAFGFPIGAVMAVFGKSKRISIK